jgi:hypothetical protein
MRMSRVGNGIVIAGAAVGAAAAVGIASGYHINLSPEMMQIVIYKGIAAAAVGLIVVGSLIGRLGRQKEIEEPPRDQFLERGIGGFSEKKAEDRVSVRADDRQGDI